MAQFKVQIRINAPKEKVWAVLADIGGIYRWNPGVTHSYSTSETNDGEGATRHCDLYNPKGYLKERVLDWREGEGFKIDIYETNLPIERNVVDFSVETDGDGTIVKVSPDYAIKYGLLGALVDWLFIQRKLKQGMDGLLAGLKYHVETGELVGTEVPG